MSSDYTDPRWQKKRLQILERDKFQCVACGCKAQTLNVHHFYYIGHRKIWDYPDDSLITICRKCHEAANARHAKGQITQWESVTCSSLKMWREMALDHWRLVAIEIENYKERADAGWP